MWKAEGMLRKASLLRSNRFTHSGYYQCGACSAVRRHWIGYEAIRDPIFLDGRKNSADFHAERTRYVQGVTHAMFQCNACHRLHDDWTKLTGQQYLLVKEHQAAEARKSNEAREG